MCKSMERKSEDELSGLLSYIKENLEKYLVDPIPCFVDFSDANNAAETIYERVEKMIAKYDEIYTNEVKTAFDRFDKDGSGAIDKSELEQLSLELGHPLNDDQLKKLSRILISIKMVLLISKNSLVGISRDSNHIMMINVICFFWVTLVFLFQKLWLLTRFLQLYQMTNL